MLRKKNNAFAKAAHIKKNTEGTSNEISLSVLDAAKQKAESSEGEDKAPFLLGHLRLFTLKGYKKTVSTPKKQQGLHLSDGGFVSSEGSSLASSSRLPSASSPAKGSASFKKGKKEKSPERAKRTPEEEISFRKARRRKRKVIAGAAAGLAIVAACALGCWTVYNQQVEQMGFEEVLLSGLQDMEKADETVLAIDGFIQEADSCDLSETGVEDLTTRANEIIESCSEAADLLSDAEEKTNAAVYGLAESGVKEAGYQALIGIEARRTMLEEGRASIEAVLDCAEAANALRAGWDCLLQADAYARESAELLSDMTTEKVKASTEKANQAIAQLQEAEAYYEQAMECSSDIEIDEYLAYADVRKRAMQCAIASNDAYLNRNKEEMEAQNKIYGELDLEAASLAKGFSVDPTEPAKSAIREVTSDESSSYASARARAAAADSVVRDYLGTKEK